MRTQMSPIFCTAIISTAKAKGNVQDKFAYFNSYTCVDVREVWNS